MEASGNNVGAGSTGTTPPAAGTTSSGGAPNQGTGPSTGAGGPTGVVGSTPSHPRSIAPTSKPKVSGKPWQDTPQGAKLTAGFEQLRTAAQHTLPGIGQQLKLLANRPIGG